MVGGGGGGDIGGDGSSASLLAATYPVNTLMELTLSNSLILRGLIYCTDDISNTIALKKALVHTTLSSEFTLVNADSVVEHKILFEYNHGNENSGSGDGLIPSSTTFRGKKSARKTDSSKNDTSAATNGGGGDGTSAAAEYDATVSCTNISNVLTEEQARELIGVHHWEELKLPLPHVNARVLEEREKRSLRLAEESLSHINQGVRLP
jgi:hypothetical protein